MSDLAKEIAEAINKNLPKEIGDNLNKRLTELEGKERLLEAEYQKNRELHLKNDELKRELVYAGDLAKRETEVTKREKDAEAKEIRQETAILQIKLDEAILRSNICKDLVQTVFRNPTFKTVEQSWGTKNVEDWNSNGMGGLNKYTRQEPDNRVTEKRTEQES